MASNGAPEIQMTSTGSHNTSRRDRKGGRERRKKGREGKKEERKGWQRDLLSVFEFVLMEWSFLPDALLNFQIYCPPPEFRYY